HTYTLTELHTFPTRRSSDLHTSIAQAQKKLEMKEGFDVALEMSGNASALRDMLHNMAHGGRIAMLGIPSQEIAIDWREVIFNMRSEEHTSELQSRVDLVCRL